MIQAAWEHQKQRLPETILKKILWEECLCPRHSPVLFSVNHTQQHKGPLEHQYCLQLQECSPETCSW